VGFIDYSSIREDYEDSFKRFGPGPKALLWWDYRSMAVRFRELVREVPVADKSIMDAGCGMGDLLPFLYAKAERFRYTGIDKSADFIEVAKQRYEGHEFRIGDPFNKKIGMYDVVLSSGVMNGNVPNWLVKRKRMIENLWEQTGEVLSFNMAGGLRPMAHDSLIAYADAREIFEYCRDFTPRVILRTDYLKNDFTVTMFKKSFIEG